MLNVVEDEEDGHRKRKTSFQTGPDRPMLLSSAKVPCYSQLAVQPNEERLGVGSICATNVVIRN